MAFFLGTFPNNARVFFFLILILLTSKIKMLYHVKISAQPLLEDNGK